MKLKNEAVSVGRYFAVLASQAAGAPLIDKAITQEREGQMRRGKGVLIRLPFTGNRPTIGLVLGQWAL